MSDEFAQPQELNKNNFEAHCIPRHVSEVISREQMEVIRFGSTDLQRLPTEIADPLIRTASDARYVYGEYVTKEGGVRNSLFVQENLIGLKLIYETDIDRAKPALLPVTNAFVVLDEGGQCVNLVEELPEGVELWYTPSSINIYMQDKRAVISGNQKLAYAKDGGYYVPNILALLHEIGHAHDAVLNPTLYMTPPISERLRIGSTKVLRNRVACISENNAAYKQYAERDFRGEQNTHHSAMLWILAMERFGCNFVPDRTKENRFNILQSYFATHQIDYFREIAADPKVRQLLFNHTMINVNTTYAHLGWDTKPQRKNLLPAAISIKRLPNK